jgi:hypothetical protein
MARSRHPRVHISAEANLACEVKRGTRGRSQNVSESIDFLHEKA